VVDPFAQLAEHLLQAFEKALAQFISFTSSAAPTLAANSSAALPKAASTASSQGW
jgi:hypothetical protein